MNKIRLLMSMLEYNPLINVDATISENNMYVSKLRMFNFPHIRKTNQSSWEGGEEKELKKKLPYWQILFTRQVL